jgi:hypothetical protein
MLARAISADMIAMICTEKKHKQVTSSRLEGKCSRHALINLEHREVDVLGNRLRAGFAGKPKTSMGTI